MFAREIKHNDPSVGNAVFYTITGPLLVVTYNQIFRFLAKPGFWVVTVFFHIKEGSQRVEIEYIYNRPIVYNKQKGLIADIIVDFLETYYPQVDRTDLSGDNWTASATVRLISQKEIEIMKASGVEFYDSIFHPDEEHGIIDVKFSEMQDLDDCVCLNKPPNLNFLNRKKKKA